MRHILETFQLCLALLLAAAAALMTDGSNVRMLVYSYVMEIFAPGSADLGAFTISDPEDPSQ